jgi:hypothetical protein
MRKADEMEKSIANKSAIITFGFYSIALFVYSIYLFSARGELGIPFTIFTTGMIVYFVSNFIFRQKTQ